MLITGDITEEKEIDLEKLHSSRLHADILKIPHHGAKTSSSELFLHTVSPDISVIPSDRIYDEPTYNRIKAMTHGEVFMPGLDGNILIATDGVRISVVTEKEHCFKSAKQQTSEIGWGNKCII
jgi:beta-lactamase superfamily II metal-dependent hydrolase